MILSSTLQTQFQEAEAAMGGHLSVRASRLGGADPVAYRDAEPAPAASTIKVYLLVALLEAVESGRLSLDDEVIVRRDDQVTGSGVLKVLSEGRPHSLRDLATLMIIVSDNTATNLVLDAVGLDALRTSLNAHGWSDTHASGKLQTVPPNPPSMTTARDLHDVMDRLWRGELLGLDATVFARATLEAQQQTDTLGRELDFDRYAQEVGASELSVAAKGGAIRGVRNEVGVLRRRDDAFVLAVTTRDCPDLRFHVDNRGSRCVSHVVRMLHDRYLGDGSNSPAAPRR